MLSQVGILDGMRSVRVVVVVIVIVFVVWMMMVELWN